MLPVAISVLFASRAAAQSANRFSDSGYREAWVDSGAVSFVRPLSDTSVMTLTVRYAPSRWQTSIGASYGVYVVRCDAQTPDYHTPLFYVASGSNEVAALAEARKPAKSVDSGERFDTRAGALALTGCIEIRRLRADARP